MRLLEANPDLTIADVEFCPETGEYRIKTQDSDL